MVCSRWFFIVIRFLVCITVSFHAHLGLYANKIDVGDVCKSTRITSYFLNDNFVSKKFMFHCNNETLINSI